MARAEVLLWACSVLLVTANLAESSGLNIGVNWGSQTSHNLAPSVVAQLLKDNGIAKVKLFDADDYTVRAFANTGIEVMLGIPNNELSRFSDSLDNAKKWVKENVTRQLDKKIIIKYIAVGNEPFLTAYKGEYTKTTFPAIQNIQKALNDAGLGDKIKATTPLNADVYDSGKDGPSGGNFRKDIRDTMVKMVRYFNSNNIPFLVNIYPFLSLYLNQDFPTDYAFFDGGGKTINDNGYTYNSVFEANFDTLVHSLKKAGVPNLKIIVGEIGWPTDGDKNANVKLAKRFYSGFLKRQAANKGTPLRPGRIETYLFSLLDEDQKSIEPGNFERHWGIFRYDGMPKFPLDFTGQGREVYPVAAKGVKYLPSQWCVVDKDSKEFNSWPQEIGYACSLSDCTRLGYGSSCNSLDQNENISYAFNMFFQMNDQDVQSCNFNGLAKIVKQNASRGNCLFPVMIESAGKRLEVVSAAAASIVAGLLMLFAILF